MAKSSKFHSGRASLGALGEYLRRLQFFAPLREQVKIPQKTVKHRPVDKLLDALIGMLCGAKTIAQRNLTVRVDAAVQRAFGRQGCAEQSTIARTLHACTAETVTQLEGLSWYYLKRYGQTPHHRLAEQRLWVDIDVTPLPIGAKAEGSERTWMGRCRSKTGRKVLRVTASDYREVLHETLLRGKASALPTLKAALRELEARLHWTRERRAQIVLRLDGGCGTTATLNWLLSRGYQLVGKISHSARVRTLRQQLGPWQPTSSPGRELATVLQPHRFGRTTRQWIMRTPKDKGRGYQYAALLTTLSELAPTAVADAYDGRASIEASFCQDKQALGMVKRRQRRWEAQQIALLLARLAHHLLVWAKRWLSREPATRRRLRGYGLVRLLQEVGTVPGVLCWQHGWLVSIQFDPCHPLARMLQRGFAALFHERVVVRCLR
jgi:molybdopterin converting factor small subunit